MKALKLCILVLTVILCSWSIPNFANISSDELNHRVTIFAKTGDEYEVWGSNQVLGYTPNREYAKRIAYAPNGGNLYIDDAYKWYFIYSPKSAGVLVDAIHMEGKGYLYNVGETEASGGFDSVQAGNCYGSIDRLYYEKDGINVLVGYVPVGWTSGGEFAGYFGFCYDSFPSAANYPSLPDKMLSNRSGSYDVYYTRESQSITEYTPGTKMVEFNDSIAYAPERNAAGYGYYKLGTYTGSQRIDLPAGTEEFFISYRKHDRPINLDTIKYYYADGSQYDPTKVYEWSGNVYPSYNAEEEDGYCNLVGSGDGVFTGNSVGYVMGFARTDFKNVTDFSTSPDITSIEVVVEDEIILENMIREDYEYANYHMYRVEMEYGEEGEIIRRELYNPDNTLAHYEIYEYNPFGTRMWKEFYNPDGTLIKKAHFYELEGDLTGESVINMEDLNVLMNRYGSESDLRLVESYQYDPSRDGYTDVADLAYVSQNFHDTEIQFEDAEFEKVLRTEINKLQGVLHEKDFDNLTYLYISGESVKNIEGIERLKYLKNITLVGCRIQDYSPINKLNGVTELSLQGCNISNIDFLSDMTNLETLRINTNSIHDITPLEKLLKLKTLNVNSNRITDLSVIANLGSLTYIDVSYNPISDYSPLDELVNCEVKKGGW